MWFRMVLASTPEKDPMRHHGRPQRDQGIRLLGVIRHAPPAERWHLVEAICYLLAARLALFFLPFDRLMPWCSRGISAPEITGSRRLEFCAEVRGAIHQVAPHLPGRTVCFPRAIAAQMMLRRRRVGTVLCYGAAVLPERGLIAHVWLQDGEEGVIGHRNAASYQVLARYSTSRS